MCSTEASEAASYSMSPQPASSCEVAVDDEDEISVGCPSPLPLLVSSSRNAEQEEEEEEEEDHHRHHRAGPNTSGGDDYFRPLKRLKMVPEQQQQQQQQQPPQQQQQSQKSEDEEEEAAAAAERGVKSFSILDILSHRPKAKIVRPWDSTAESSPAARDLGMSLSGSISEPPLSSSSSCSSVSDSGSPDPLHHHHHHHSVHAMHFASLQHQQLKRKSQQQQQKRAPGQGSPLDALFQMTSKTFDAGEHSQEQASHLNLFNNRQQPKKKRKSRTAFTNQQIFELEKRFLYQKYLSPADRDEIAAQLGLSNAQVITWFQNRRAKLKRDMEELKKDVQTVGSPLLVTSAQHKTFLESVQDLGILKKRPLPPDPQTGS